MTPTYRNLTGVPDKDGRTNRYTTTGLKSEGHNKNIYELHDGHQSNAEHGQNNLMFIKFVGRSPSEKRELERLAMEEVSLSEDTAFESVVRYKDYIEEQDMLVVEEANWKGIQPGTYMSDEELLILAGDVLSALSYLHDRGQAHGFVHPSNIIPFERSEISDPNRRRGFKLIGHGLVPKVMWTWNDIPGEQFTPPEFRDEGRKYRPTRKGDVWMLGRTLAELHSYGRSEGLEHCSTVRKPNDWTMPFAGWQVEESDRCDKHRHDQLNDLLKEMLQPTIGKRMKAEVALDRVVGEYLTNIHPSMTLALMLLKDAKKRVRKEQPVMRRLWIDLKSLLFIVMSWVWVLSCHYM
ncbi:hypothetical protein CKAH01_05545 [Colletotrichum kahawae]|uniref:Protein kinase domain-containing protein n=1 Tax=Colletotrichum kahawae TaxID=34407 RepID=A0AAE0D636_COLKA|nr:hypothetical protein CKAH01_05545 [Colletotrichum kahawae]